MRVTCLFVLLVYSTSGLKAAGIGSPVLFEDWRLKASSSMWVRWMQIRDCCRVFHLTLHLGVDVSGSLNKHYCALSRYLLGCQTLPICSTQLQDSLSGQLSTIFYQSVALDYFYSSNVSHRIEVVQFEIALSHSNCNCKQVSYYQVNVGKSYGFYTLSFPWLLLWAMSA